MKSELILPFAMPETLRDLMYFLQGQIAVQCEHPSNGDYQRGYEAALINMRDNLACWLASK